MAEEPICEKRIARRTDRRKSARELLAAGRQNARATARALEELLAPELEEGRPMPDLVYLQQLFAAALERCWRRLELAEEARDDALDHRHALVVERDDDLRALYREVVDLRTVVRGRFGTEPSERFLGLYGATSRDPVALLRQADRAVARLDDDGRPLPPSKVRSPDDARSRWSSPVARAAGILRATVDRLLTAFKQVDAAGLDRQRALSGFNEVFVGIAGWFEATYRLIGRDDQADAVRPSKQYPGLTYEQGKSRPGRGARPAAKATVARFPRLEPVLRLFGSREKAQ